MTIPAFRCGGRRLKNDKAAAPPVSLTSLRVRFVPRAGKANPFGVTILNVKITNVQLPPDLSQTLQNTTSFKTMMEQQEKKHTADMRILLDNAEQKLTAIKRNNERGVQDLRAAQQRALVSREEQLVTSRTSLEVSMVNAKTEASVAKTQADSQKLNAKAEGERRKIEVVEKIRAEAEADKIRADQQLQASWDPPTLIGHVYLRNSPLTVQSP